MWARPRLRPGCWGSMRCQRWQTQWAALVLHSLTFQHWSFSGPITCCCYGCFHGVHLVRFMWCNNSYRTSQTIFLMTRRHLIFSICDLLLEFLIPESCDQAFQKSLLQSLSRVSDKDSHHTWSGCHHRFLWMWIVGWRLSGDDNTGF